MASIMPYKQRRKSMARTVSSSEAQNNFGAMMQWAEENSEGVVVERRGKPTAAIISYEEYQTMLQFKEQERKRKAFERMEIVRKRIAARNQDLTTEEAYRLAGFSEEVIQEILANDPELVETP
jgi:prevent-host-death family protein